MGGQADSEGVCGWRIGFELLLDGFDGSMKDDIEKFAARQSKTV
jgi:hypothetical protein